MNYAYIITCINILYNHEQIEFFAWEFSISYTFFRFYFSSV